MSLLQTEIFDVAEKRLAWTSERQAVLARNIANLSTPGFQAEDAAAFKDVLAGSTGVHLARTEINHMAGTTGPGLAGHALTKPTARTADKNGIRMEEQLMKVADTETLHATVTAIYKKYVAMFGIALGKGA